MANLHEMMEAQMSRSTSEGQSSKEGRQCPACPELRKGNKRFCATHNTAFECIARSACKPPEGMEHKVKAKIKKRQDKKKKKGKQKGQQHLLKRDAHDRGAPGVQPHFRRGQRQRK